MTLAHDRVGPRGRTLALLHGVGGGRAIWDRAHGGAAQLLADAGWDVIAFDLPGYGGSALVQPLTMGAMAHAVIESLRELGTAPVVLVGHSMGGMVAQEVVALAPEVVRGMVLACTSSAFGRPEADWQQAFLSQRLAPLDAGLGMPALARQLVSAMVAADAAAQAVQAAIDVMQRVPEATYRAALQAIVGFDRRSGLAAIGVPVLCLSAEHDRTAPADVMARMAQRLPLGRHHCVPAAGHLVSVEKPQAFCAAVAGFLDDAFQAR
jgi:3-oxoadipate enol-lactonase